MQQPGYIARYCKLNKRISTLGLDKQVLNQLTNLFVEADNDDLEREEENYANQLENDDVSSLSTISSDEDEKIRTSNCKHLDKGTEPSPRHRRNLS